MNRRIASAAASIIGLIVVILAVLSATLWRPSSLVQATSPTPDQPYVVTERGVLGVVNSNVTVTASAPGQNITLAVAQAADVQAWLEQDPYTSVSGLSSWTALNAAAVTERCAPADGSTPTASPSASTSADASASPSTSATAAADANGCTTLTPSGATLAGSDLWLETGTGEGTVQLSVDATDPNLVVIAATDGTAAAPTLSLQWDRNVATPWLIPGLILGGLLILVGVFGWVFDHLLRRADEERRRRAAERAARVAQADSTATVGFPVVTGDPNRPLTRRESREKERAAEAGEEWLDPRTGELYLAGELISRLKSPSRQDSDDASDEDEDLRAAGVSRGAAVVPALDEEATQALRAQRELDDDAPFAIASDDEESDDASDEEESSSEQDAGSDSGTDEIAHESANEAANEVADHGDAADDSAPADEAKDHNDSGDEADEAGPAHEPEAAEADTEGSAEASSDESIAESGQAEDAETEDAPESAQHDEPRSEHSEDVVENDSAFGETRVFAPIEEDSVFGDSAPKSVQNSAQTSVQNSEQTSVQTSVQTTNEEKSE